MCPLGTSAITFKIYSLHTQWVCDGHIDSVPTMNSPCTHWVNDPSPPVYLGSNRIREATRRGAFLLLSPLVFLLSSFCRIVTKRNHKGLTFVEPRPSLLSVSTTGQIPKRGLQRLYVTLNPFITSTTALSPG